MLSKKYLFCVFLCALFLFSCKKDDPVPSKDSSNFWLIFEPTVNSKNFIPDTEWYTNFAGDSFTVTKFNYYVSNIRLKRSDGSMYKLPQTYHLIQHVQGKQRIFLQKLAQGDYTEIEFLIGVDSLHNVSGTQSGDLDPSLNMFWDWNTGYIFYKLEGRFNTMSTPVNADYAIHVGGYKGKDNCLQSYSGKLPETLRLRQGQTSVLHMNVKLEEVFVNPLFMDFDTYYSNVATILPDVARNYRDMFVPVKIEN